MCVFVRVLGECYLCVIVDGQYLLEARVATLCMYEFCVLSLRHRMMVSLNVRQSWAHSEVLQAFRGLPSEICTQSKNSCSKG